MGRRAFLPPSTCVRCGDRPALGEVLFHTGTLWICAACLTEESPGSDTSEKFATRFIQAEQAKALSRRARTAGDVEQGLALAHESDWHQNAAATLYEAGTRLANGTVVVNTEAIPRGTGYLKDTLADPDLAAIESSEARGRLLQMNEVVALGVDVANTAGASNTHEKLISHQIALAHKVAMEQANQASHERDPAMEIKRLQISARMMATAQQGVLTLRQLKSGGIQSVVVQHVHVAGGGQAVVGNVQSGSRTNNR